MQFHHIYPHETEWTLFQTQNFSENQVASGTEPGTSVSAGRKCYHKTTEAVCKHGYPLVLKDTRLLRFSYR
jgi:hypothetical protein